MVLYYYGDHNPVVLNSKCRHCKLNDQLQMPETIRDLRVSTIMMRSPNVVSDIGTPSSTSAQYHNNIG